MSYEINSPFYQEQMMNERYSSCSIKTSISSVCGNAPHDVITSSLATCLGCGIIQTTNQNKLHDVLNDSTHQTSHTCDSKESHTCHHPCRKGLRYTTYSRLENRVGVWNPCCDCYFSALPDDMLISEMFTFLDYTSLLTAASTCRRWSFLCNAPSLWRKVVLRDKTRAGDNAQHVFQMLSTKSSTMRTQAVQRLRLRAPQLKRIHSPIQVYLPSLQHIDLQGCKGMDTQSLSCILGSTRNLQQLYLSGVTQATDECLIPVIKRNHTLVVFAVAHCRQLSDATLDAIRTSSRNLEYLDVTNCTKMTTSGLQNCFSGLGGCLKGLKIRGVKWTEKKVVDQIDNMPTPTSASGHDPTMPSQSASSDIDVQNTTNIDVGTTVTRPAALHRDINDTISDIVNTSDLDVSRTESMPRVPRSKNPTSDSHVDSATVDTSDISQPVNGSLSPPISFVRCIASMCSLLETIDLSSSSSIQGVYNVSGNDLVVLFSHCPNLRQVSLATNRNISLEHFTVALSHLSGSLTHLDLSHIPFITDDWIKILIHYCGQIQELRVAGATQLTCTSLQYFTQLSELTYLDIGGCVSIGAEINELVHFLTNCKPQRLTNIRAEMVSNFAFALEKMTNVITESVSPFVHKAIIDNNQCDTTDEGDIGSTAFSSSQLEVIYS